MRREGTKGLRAAAGRLEARSEVTAEEQMPVRRTAERAIGCHRRLLMGDRRKDLTADGVKIASGGRASRESEEGSAMGQSTTVQKPPGSFRRR